LTEIAIRNQTKRPLTGRIRSGAFVFTRPSIRTDKEHPWDWRGKDPGSLLQKDFQLTTGNENGKFTGQAAVSFKRVEGAANGRKKLSSRAKEIRKNDELRKHRLDQDRVL